MTTSGNTHQLSRASHYNHHEIMEMMSQKKPGATELQALGPPFSPFPSYSLHDLPVNMLDWVETKLEEGRPFVIRNFDELDAWDRSIFTKKALFDLISLESRNCRTGRDVRVSAREFALNSGSNQKRKGAARDMLYAKDLQCPQPWVHTLNRIIPAALQYQGPLDLFRALSDTEAPEVLMAYVGSRNSFSGFHRCFSGTVAMNLMLESDDEGPGAVCFGIDNQSKSRFDIFMTKLGHNAQTDWANISTTQMADADFPIYVHDQRPGDLVVFPPMCSHQVWNVASSVTKVVWNILHISSAELFQNEIHPVYQQQCHVDTARVPLVLFNTLHEIHERSGWFRPKEAAIVLNLFQQLVNEEVIEPEPSTPVRSVDIQGNVLVEVHNFVKFKTFVEQIMQESRVPLLHPEPLEHRSLGTLAQQGVLLRQQPQERLCHLCRDNHPHWKGLVCDNCSSFFCYRGLFRRFDMDSISLLRSKLPWNCPKCSHICNCRCCHFPHPYKQQHRPPGTRIKAVDPRGSTYGFMDNVFDMSRGKQKENEASTPAANSISSPGTSRRGQKRPRGSDGDHLDTSSAIADLQPVTIRDGERAGESQPTFVRRISMTAGTRDTADQTQVSAHNTARPRNSIRVENLLTPDTVGPSNGTRGHQMLTASNASPAFPQTPEHTTINSSIASPQVQTHRNRLAADGINATPDIRSIDKIPALQEQLETLSAYADDLLELGLIDTRTRVLDRARQLETQISEVKRKKAHLLFSKMRNDFPDLADLATEEARRQNLVI
ncbi:hypothetical protein N7452_010672 [Penicillium brevicompactum]|uniref:JmjC domain-containing protein n=1 Tax=Penicillium brevicompactum TaxID=5074 RepID=A0A9W9U784_PENBR|nr:hypothetical protein N7452_010672 [Penicillium brevicompactum]